jgi:glycosyltransferase involved in cell wall biosynthesis
LIPSTEKFLVFAEKLTRINSRLIEFGAKFILYVGLRGRKFEPDLYSSWQGGEVGKSVNPYIHAALFGINETILGLGSRFLDFKQNDSVPEKKWLLIVTHDQSRTGAPVLALNLIVEFRKKYNVAVLALGPGELRANYLEAANYYAQNHGSSKTGKRFTRRIKRLCDDLAIEYALVNSVESANVIEGLLGNNVQSLALIHEFPGTPSYSVAQVQGLNSAKKIVVSSQILAASVSEHLSPIDRNKVTVIPQARSNVPKDLTLKGRGDLKFRRLVDEALSSADKSVSLRVVGAGVVQHRKGVDLFVALASLVSKNPLYKNSRFLWVGNGFNPATSSYSRQIQDQIESLGLSDTIQIIPASPDFEYCLEICDIFALTSRVDPLPNVVLDAMSFGKPIVCFDKASGYPELFSNLPILRAGIASCMNPEDLADRVIELHRTLTLSTDGNLKAQIKEFVEEKFSLEDYVAALDSLATH